MLRTQIPNALLLCFKGKEHRYKKEREKTFSLDTPPLTYLT